MNLISHKYKYILRVFPKSGCSTLRNLFLNLHWKEFNFSHKPADDDFHNSCPMENEESFDKYKDYHRICVVRNSYERVISMYFNRFLDIPDFNSMPPASLTDEWYLNRGVASPTTFDDFLYILGTDLISSNEHYEPQELYLEPDKFNHIIHLDKMNDTLPKIYKDLFQFEDNSVSMIKTILSDKKEKAKRRDLRSYGKLNNYDFKGDKHKFDIMRNGIPFKNQMITEENAKVIKDLYNDEIILHNFDYKHLL